MWCNFTENRNMQQSYWVWWGAMVLWSYLSGTLQTVPRDQGSNPRGGNNLFTNSKRSHYYWYHYVLKRTCWIKEIQILDGCKRWQSKKDCQHKTITGEIWITDVHVQTTFYLVCGKYEQKYILTFLCSQAMKIIACFRFASFNLQFLYSIHNFLYAL